MWQSAVGDVSYLILLHNGVRNLSVHRDRLNHPVGLQHEPARTRIDDVNLIRREVCVSVTLRLASLPVLGPLQAAVDGKSLRLRAGVGISRVDAMSQVQCGLRDKTLDA